jgi:hypothetical protein
MALVENNLNLQDSRSVPIPLTAENHFNGLSVTLRIEESGFRFLCTMSFEIFDPKFNESRCSQKVSPSSILNGEAPSELDVLRNDQDFPG